MVITFLEGFFGFLFLFLFFWALCMFGLFVNFALRGWRLKVISKQIMVWKREVNMYILLVKYMLYIFKTAQPLPYLTNVEFVRGSTIYSM